MRAAMCFGHVRRSPERNGDARPDVITQCYGAKKTVTVDAELFSQGQRSRDDRAPGMRLRKRMRVIGLVGMTEHSIRQRRLDGTTKNIGSDDRRDLFAFVTPGELDRKPAGWKFGTGDDGRQSVQDRVLGFLDDGVGKFPRAGVGHESRKCRREVCRSYREQRTAHSGQAQACAELQEIASGKIICHSHCPS